MLFKAITKYVFSLIAAGNGLQKAPIELKAGRACARRIGLTDAADQPIARAAAVAGAGIYGLSGNLETSAGLRQRMGRVKQ